MNRLLLCFRLAPRSGQPRLFVQAGEVTTAERTRLEDEVRRHYQRLVGLGGAVVRFSTRLAAWGQEPLLCRVRVDHRIRRCPVLWLMGVPVAAIPAGGASREEAGSEADWVDGLWREIDGALGDAASVEEVRGVCADLWRLPARQMAARVLVDYLEQRALDMPDGHPRREVIVRLADRLRGILPGSGLSGGRREGRSMGWLRRVGQRLLGLG